MSWSLSRQQLLCSVQCSTCGKPDDYNDRVSIEVSGVREVVLISSFSQIKEMQSKRSSLATAGWTLWGSHLIYEIMITFMEQLVSIFSLSLTEMIAYLIHFCTTSQTMRNVGRKVIQKSMWSPGVSRLVQMNLQCESLSFLMKVTNRKPYGAE